MAKLSNASPEELHAISLRWHAQHPDAALGAEPTPEESVALLDEIRTRVAAIEGETWKMLAQATRNSPSRSGANSKYMQLFWLVFVPVSLLCALAYYLWGLRHR